MLVLGVAGCSTAPSTAHVDAASPTAAASSAAPDPAPTAPDQTAALAALEQQFGARVGVSAIDTVTGEQLSFRADERFGYASTLKVFAAAAFLHDVPASERQTVVTYTAADVEAAGYSPVTSESIGTGLTLSQLAEAAVRRSDNTAMNLILNRLGGPAALDAALREQGDDVSEVVNSEPALNVIEPSSTDDTSTPAAFTANLSRLIDGPYLATDDRAILLEWMTGNTTGDTLIRAGAPSGWNVADKSGGAGSIRNDIAVVTPPGGHPIVVTIFTNTLDPDAAYDDALVTGVARAVLSGLE
ncbi:hypothetical protein B7R22_01820 [Subtercola boreus]|uniref:Beta-lactamase n=2 Tax=Subtercola boreus TaxID=120213 RepID=A0A3E0W7D4_9MICO|nr:hypothetical protein B7R22_01820 [Subtercola boreus]